MIRLVRVSLIALVAACGAWAADTDASAKVTKPYTLDTCPVSGEKLDNDAVVKVYDGREVKFCCNKCPAKYEANRAKYDAEIDAKSKAKAKDAAKPAEVKPAK